VSSSSSSSSRRRRRRRRRKRRNYLCYEIQPGDPLIGQYPPLLLPTTTTTTTVTTTTTTTTTTAPADRWHPDLTEEEIDYLNWFAANPAHEYYYCQ